MSLKDKITLELKNAMKSGDKTRLQTVRSIRALILEFEKSGQNMELTPELELNMLSTAAKKRKESIEQYRKAGRDDLADQEEAELKIIQEFLPEQLNEEEILLEIKRIAQEVGASSKADFPKLMPAVMKELKGKAEGKIIKGIVDSYLGAG